VSAVAELVVACLLVWLLFACFLFLAVSAGLPQRRARTRARRRRGYIPPSLNAYGYANHTMGKTLEREGTFTGCRTAGRRPEDRGGRALRVALSRTIALTPSSEDLATRLGGHTTDAATHEAA
jgi:hypothetical protein